MKSIYQFVYLTFWLSVCAACVSDDEYPRYRYGHCYQPLYWPSDCIDDPVPTLEEDFKRRRAQFRKRKNAD